MWVSVRYCENESEYLHAHTNSWYQCEVTLPVSIDFSFSLFLSLTLSLSEIKSHLSKIVSECFIGVF